MIRRMAIAILAVTALALVLAAVAPRAEAISFVDKQVQAGGLLIQNYINKYGTSHHFIFPAKAMVKKGGGLPDSTLMWPANPWTGKVMGSGTSRGTYTYTLGTGGISYRLTMHFSSGSYVFRGSMPAWFKSERNTASRQNLLLLQRYVEAYAGTNGGTYPTADTVTAAGLGTGYVWPANPWTGAGMVVGDTLGCYGYTQLNGGTGYTLKVMLTSGWSTTLGPLPVLVQLSTSPDG